jgi:sugar phosphate isomerase/epimerase
VLVILSRNQGDEEENMAFRGFGYTVEVRGHAREPLRELDERLQALAEVGYTHAEIFIETWDVCIGGCVNSRQLVQLLEVLDAHRDHLSYTYHLPSQINLFDLADRDMHERLLQSGIEVGKAIGAESMVYHPGFRLRSAGGTSVAMFDLMARERETLLDLADRVANWSGHIAIETWIDTGGVGYSYAIWPELLAMQVETINHPAVGLCLDFGHVYIAARWYGFGFLQGVARLAPLTTHLHVADSMGIMDFANRNDPALGRGDLHLPLGWGVIPFEDVFSRFDFPKCSVFTLELRDRFFPHIDSDLVESKRLVSLGGSSSTSQSSSD